MCVEKMKQSINRMQRFRTVFLDSKCREINANSNQQLTWRRFFGKIERNIKE